MLKKKRDSRGIIRKALELQTPSSLRPRTIDIELIEIQRHAQKYSKYLDAQAQHGPVKVLWKDGKPVNQEDK
jgi:hypothetical protein